MRASVEVVFHEGYLSRKEARRALGGGQGAAPETVAKPPRPEVSGAMQAYIDLHRHAAMRPALLAHPTIALRLMVAHAIAGSPLWSVRPEPQAAHGEETRESVETARAKTVFDERRRAVLGLLGFPPEDPTVVGGEPAAYEGDVLAAIFRRLLALPDAAVLDVLAVVVVETLAAGSPVIEAAGLHIGLDMADWWQTDGAFFDLVRDREVMTRTVADIAGESVAAANAGEKLKTLKRIAVDHLDGTGGRPKVGRWVPRWMASRRPRGGRSANAVAEEIHGAGSLSHVRYFRNGTISAPVNSASNGGRLHRWRWCSPKDLPRCQDPASPESSQRHCSRIGGPCYGEAGSARVARKTSASIERSDWSVSGPCGSSISRTAAKKRSMWC
ncbi:hypothetical protein [Sphingomonas cannabina]|uniref:hypothetical protein n=1 Tax=Sphingomonas cannabina TaxID=2899123 RepID=UPI0029E80A05|nr:hypothetical protein [Sphingomonas cannabina]